MVSFFVSQHLDLLGECQVGGDQRRSSLMTLGEKVEQQLAAGSIERDEPQFIDDQQRSPQEPLVKTSQRANVSCFEKVSHHVRCSDEHHSVTSTSNFHPQRDGKIRLSGPNGVGDYDIFCILDELTLCQLQYFGPRDSAKDIPVDLVQRLHIGEACLA